VLKGSQDPEESALHAQALMQYRCTGIYVLKYIYRCIMSRH